VTDYGHPLVFGSFLTPSAGDPQAVVSLAQLCERVGLDLVTFQDHPYQSRFLDTWTLMAYVAAATNEVRLSANVLNLPLRPPVVVARSVASLDLLSGGRVELGLGAGAFWDAIEANGGRRLSPGESLEALEEAIGIIREVWATDRRGGVRTDGRHYPVSGAKRGPTPAHDIAIWVGGLRPRMLQLIGRVADGWLPSLSYLPDGLDSLPAMTTMIDQGAKAAGRDPSAIRRMLNISGRFSSSSGGPFEGRPGRWAESIAALVVEHGFSGFILASDDPDELALFGQEVAPEARELVAAERGDPDGSRVGAADVPPAARVGGSTVFRTAPTPDPGVRLTDHALWDESLRPEAPPAPAGYAYSEHAQAVGAHLVEVHDHLRAELSQLRGVIRQVEQGTVTAAQARGFLNELTLRQNNWALGAYCASYCRLVTEHHRIEDRAVFPHLRDSDADLVPVVDRLEQEHVVIHGVVEAVDRALVAALGDRKDFTGLQSAVDLLTDTLLSHLAYEEQQIIEPIARYGFYAGQV
jgi:alkanesulfonate monooxygenase SsuD/methylene tetrahydromethanopterin reductase-like flavin-dependent oxidoreductase (luciferase family)